MLTFIQGKKTYIVAGLMCIYAVVGYFLGKETPDELVKMILEALAVAGLRAGIAKK